MCNLDGFGPHARGLARVYRTQLEPGCILSIPFLRIPCPFTRIPTSQDPLFVLRFHDRPLIHNPFVSTVRSSSFVFLLSSLKTHLSINANASFLPSFLPSFRRILLVFVEVNSRHLPEKNTRRMGGEVSQKRLDTVISMREYIRIRENSPSALTNRPTVS